MYILSVDLHSRRPAFDIPALVQLACKYNSHIHLRNTMGDFDTKSIMGMMSFDFLDRELKVVAEGADEREAAEAIFALLNNN